MENNILLEYIFVFRQILGRVALAVYFYAVTLGCLHGDQFVRASVKGIHQ